MIGNASGRILMATDEGFAYDGIKGNVAYKPTSPYSPKNDTGITKTNYLYDGIVNDGTFINKSLLISVGTSALLYTVPETKTFFLTTATIHSYAKIVGDNQSGICIDSASTTTAIVLISQDAINFGTAVSVSPALPLKFKAGTKVYILSNAKVNTCAAITGYEIETSLLNTFR